LTDAAGIPALIDAIRHLHDCGAKHVETVHVRDTAPNGEVAWDGDVEVFDLIGSAKVKRAYAWSEATTGKKRRFFAVLHVPPERLQIRPLPEFPREHIVHAHAGELRDPEHQGRRDNLVASRGQANARGAIDGSAGTDDALLHIRPTLRRPPRTRTSARRPAPVTTTTRPVRSIDMA